MVKKVMLDPKRHHMREFFIMSVKIQGSNPYAFLDIFKYDSKIDSSL